MPTASTKPAPPSAEIPTAEPLADARSTSEQLRILILVQTLYIGGLEKMVRDLSRELNISGKIQLQVCAYEQPAEDSRQNFVADLRSCGIVVHTLHKPVGFSLSTVFQIARLVKKERLSIIHSHDLGALLYAAMAKIVLLGKVRLVHTQHSLVNLAERWRNRLYQRVFARFVDQMVTVSDETARLYREIGVGKAPLSVVHNGIAVPAAPTLQRSIRLQNREELLGSSEITEPLKSRLDSMRNAVWLLYIARIHPVKGQLQALKLWSELPSALHSRAALLIVGPEAFAGEMAKLLELVRTCPSPDRIFVLGGTTKPKLWYDAADVALSCSEFEGLPLGPLEAIAHGLPMLLSDIIGHRFLSSRAEFYPLDNPQVGARKLSSLIEQAESPTASTANQLKARAEWVREEYSLEKMCRAYEEIYRS